ncbi:hypothetical protein JJB11_06620 [Ramlibacter ginsenosidimutans]|uniref:Uncharacterized protein n=1 Tax=Ramlibacter ginsenosidimutans TaxID=502333 RepID=A0A934WKI4_9BURK|nr:hypothetical protein [Ramlibacter ginsenosidimutans]MBK6005764.1 hypothetical protein [Ramlibacter ginsenosidimutans]
MARLALCVGLDRAVLALLLARGWPVAAGLVTLVMISRFLTVELQGYFFTFVSLIAWQSLVELGLLQAIVHFASHEAATLSWTHGRRIEGPEPARQRLRSLLHFSLKWLGAGALALVAALLPIGWILLGSGDGAVRDSARAAWVLLVPLAAINLTAAGAFAVLEGCGKVADVGFGRLVQSVGSVLALWAALAGGAGLYSLVLQAGVSALIAVGWLAGCYGGFFTQVWRLPRRIGAGIRWRSEIWPFQWRMAVSWASGVLIAQLFTPLLFASCGPAPAGQMGLALQAFGGINMLALAWVSAQVPVYGRLIALGQGRELDRLFWRAVLQSAGALFLLLACVLAAVWELTVLRSPLSARLPPLPLVAVFCVVSLANHLIFAQATLLRAHREDPFMVLSLASGAVTAVMCVTWIPPYGLAGAVAAYAVATLGVGLVGGTTVFLRKRREWWLMEGNARAAKESA